MSAVEVTKIRRLVKGQILTGVIAVIALAIALLAFNAKTQAIQTSRRDGRLDSCFLLRELAYTAGGREQHKAVTAFIDRGPLSNCYVYADHLPGGHHHQ